jgi:putative transposase
MSRKRRTFAAAFKARVALAAARGDRTTAQLASEFSVHTSQVTAWKKQLLDHVSELFEDGRRKEDEASLVNEQELYEQIGRLKMEAEWLKKNLPSSIEGRRRCIDTKHSRLSVARQCALLGLARSTRYYAPQGETWR